MNLDLPTEEDVLAHLVLFAAKPVVTNAYSSEQIAERTAWNAATAELDVVPNPVSVVALRRLRDAGTIEAAIADSERRLAIEQAREEVLLEARRHARNAATFGLRMTATDQVVADLEALEAES